jgi:outer membrane protein OmpA-like peptidoglycan-associated protein
VKPIPAETLKAALDARGKASLHLPFVFNRPTPRADAAEMIADIAQLLRENPALRLAIECHTDNIAPRRESLALAAARAAALRDALAAAGIDPGRLTPIGVGPDHPVADNDSSENRARNRRVVLVRK